MNKICLTLFLIFLLFACTNALQLKHQSYPSLHLATNQQKQAYLKQLLQIEDDLDISIQEMIKEAQDSSDRINQNDELPDVQTQMFQQTFDYERSRLFNLEQSLMLPLGNKTWGCQNLTKQEAQKINNQIIETQKSIHKLEEKLQNQPECPVTDQTEKQIQFLKIYISHLSHELQNLCEKPASFKTYFLPAPNSNYTYGDDGQQGYRKKIKKALDDGYKTANCPSNTPYPKQNQCVICPNQTIYDLTKAQCLKCPTGYYFSQDFHKCSRIALAKNPEAQNFQGQPPLAGPNAQVCEADTPFFNGDNCVSCSSPSFFNFKTNTCEACQVGLFFNLITKLCGYAPHNTNPIGTNVCCGTIVKNPDYQDCPQDAPFYNGKQCIYCDYPSYFDLETAACKYCEQGQGFSLKLHKCVDIKYLETMYNSTIDKDSMNYFGKPPVIEKEYENIINCDKSTPFYDQKACIKCQYPSYFNFETNQCLVCPQQFEFSLQFHKCVSVSSDKFNTNMTSLNNFKGKIHPFDPSLQTCKGQTPFFNGIQCIECALPRYVDFDQSKCKQCPSNMIFNLFNRQCIVDPQSYYTNLNAGNIYYNGDYSIIEKQIENVKANNKGAEQCDINIPYYNASTGKCIMCPQENPLFDYKYNRCISCPESSEYNSNRHICITSGGVTPTIERMMMNTIGII